VKSCNLFLYLMVISCLFLSGCALLGLIEIEGAAGLAEGVMATDVAVVSETATTSSVLSVAAEAETITEFRIVIRSSVNTDAYSLLRTHLSPAEFDVIEGMVRNEGSVNSLLSKVRVARAGTSVPRLFIKIAEGEGVEFAEVTSNRTIRLIRSGREYSLPGEIYTTRGGGVLLNDLQNYRVMAHINPHQVILVLDEVPVNGMLKARIGT
jgi:hypothetical protein